MDMKKLTLEKFPTISIVFPNYNGGNEPLECLQSVRKLNYPKSKIEVIIIDNNSSDGSDLEIKKHFPKVNLIKNKQNLGFAKAVNMGIKKSKGSYIFIGNDDLVLEKNSLKKMVEFMFKNPRVGVLGGKIFYKSSPKKICSAGYFINHWTGNVYKSKNHNQIYQPDWVQGCAILVPKAVFNQIGLLDENFVLLFDDFDLCTRARKKGFKIFYLPEAIFWHGESVTVDRNKSFKYFHWYKSKFYFLIKHYPLLNLLSIFLLQILIITPYRAIFLQDGRLSPFLKGLSWNIMNLPKTIVARQ